MAGVLGPPGPESRTSPQGVYRGLPAPGSEKCPKQSRQSRNSLRSLKILECHKCGFKRWGFKQNPRKPEEKCPFPLFSGFSRCSVGLPEKGEKGRRRAKKADFGRFPGREARHPLNPHLLHPHLRHSKNRLQVLRLRRLFRDCFQTLFGFGAGDSFEIPGSEGPGDSCKRCAGLQCEC